MLFKKTKSFLLILLSTVLGGLASFALNLITTPAGLSTPPQAIPAADTRLLTASYSTPVTAANPFGSLQVHSSPFPTMPKVPGVPAMPGTLGTPKSSGEKLVGILYPDFVIVSKGNRTLTLPCNSESEFGYIGGITGKGVYIDGKLVTLNENTQTNKKQAR